MIRAVIKTIRRNNRIEFMNLPKSGYRPIKNFFLRNPLEKKLEGAVYEKSNHT